MDHSAIIITLGIGGTKDNYISARAISPFKHHFMSASPYFSFNDFVIGLQHTKI